MSSTYVVRLLSADPANSAQLVLSTAPGSLTTYGPHRFVVGWAAQTIAGALTNIEQSVTFSDPDQNGHISNLASVTFRVNGDHKQQVAYVGLFPTSCLGADRGPSLLDALMLAPAIAYPGGRQIVEPNSPLTLDIGALVFTPN